MSFVLQLYKSPMFLQLKLCCLSISQCILYQSKLLNKPNISIFKVYQVKLSAAGITNLGQLTPYGFYKTRHAPLEVFYNGAPLRLARWPNEGFINIKHVLDGTHGRRFSYDSDRPRRWSSENDLWTFGYWY